MTNLKLLSLILIISLASCTKKNIVKQYKYIVTFEKPALFGAVSYKDGEIENLSAENDSIAYCEAYEKYCLAKKVYADYADEYNSKFPTNIVDTPIAFKLINEMGNDIVNSVDFIDKSIIELKIEEETQKLPNSLKKNKK